MEKRKGGRKKQRVTCELEIEGRCHRGIVLDLSPRGVFVQTDASPAPGTELHLRLRRPGGDEIEVDARVARKRLVPRHLASVASRGVGLEIKNAPEAFFDLLGGKRPPSGTLPAAATQRFRVRVKQVSGPRSRSLVVTADSQESAVELALAEVGEGWTVLAVETTA